MTGFFAPPRNLLYWGCDEMGYEVRGECAKVRRGKGEKEMEAQWLMLRCEMTRAGDDVADDHIPRETKLIESVHVTPVRYY